MELKGLLKINSKLVPVATDMPTLLDIGPSDLIASLTASLDGHMPPAPGQTHLSSTLNSLLWQDDDAHDTCSLTACLNPLHPGPCKGWKGTLFDAAPGAWHAIEGAKVEKANTARLKKITDLKAKGLPIPHKLLTPIVAKPHPNAGKTANKASGEAHEASKAISESSGVHVKEPGKVTLGKAVKPTAPAALGPKGKKPTVASKGVAHVIAQEKVTPQYKLDKAAAITPEQWSALSADDKAMVRAELGKIKKDGFGPQQKKADDLLTKLADKPAEPTPVEKAQAKNAAFHKEQAAAAKTAPIKLGDAAQKAVAKQSARAEQDTVKGRAHIEAEAAKAALPPTHAVTLGHLKDGMTRDEWHAAGGNLNAIDLLLKKGLVVKGGTKTVKIHGEDVDQITYHHAPNSPAVPSKAPEAALPNPAPKALPKHVQYAVDMANGHAPGATWSKNHLAAYQELSAEDFHGLPKDTQDKVTSELSKAVDKFLDPKKVQASKDLLAKFGKGPSTPNVDKTPKPKAAEKAVDFATHLHDHNVTHAQAKEAVEKTGLPAHFAAAKMSAGLTDMDNPNLGVHKLNAGEDAEALVHQKTKLYNTAVLNLPEVKAAVEGLHSAAMAQAHAQSVHDAKQKAFNKIGQKLAADDGKLSPIEKASLLHLQKHILDHPVQTDTPHMDSLKADTKAAGDALEVALHDAVKKANAPDAHDMTTAQLNDAVGKLLGPDAVHPKIALTAEEQQAAIADGKGIADTAGWKHPDVLTDPVVAAKQGDLAKAAAAEIAAKHVQDKFAAYLDKNHLWAMSAGESVHGVPLTAADKLVLHKHASDVSDAHNIEKDVTDAKAKTAAAKTAFDDAAEAAKANATPPDPFKLTDFDTGTIDDAYSNAWGKHAEKSVTYGAKTYAQGVAMKAHADYPALKTDLGQLKFLAGMVALAHAKEHTAHLNVPTDPDTGFLETGPEKTAYLAAMNERHAVEEQFNALHKQAQAKLDTVRAAVGLKKRALPKIDSAAVKTSAAESGFHKSTGYGAPNVGKSTAGKNYMLAKVGPKLAVVHKTSGDKMVEKLGDTVGTPSTPKVKNVPAPSAPVSLGDADSAIAHIPDQLKKTITADFKDMPDGKYLADPAEDIFGNLVNLAAAHGKGVPDGLSVDQVLKTIDETHSKSLGVANSGMLHAKITDWLGTPAGKAYAEGHSTPDAGAVKHILGEVVMPEGVTLEPGQKVQTLAGPGAHDKTLDASAFKPLTALDAQQAQDKAMKANGIKWTAAQKAAIKSYTGSTYQTYNSFLRGDGDGSPSTKQAVVNIQSAMIPLPEHTLLKRGTGWPPELAKFQSDPKALLDKTFEDKAFVSTTVAGSSGHFSGQALQLTIEAPKGTPAAFVNGISHYKGQENEMLLAAGTKFKVLSVEVVGGKTHMRVRIVGNK